MDDTLPLDETIGALVDLQIYMDAVNRRMRKANRLAQDPILLRFALPGTYFRFEMIYCPGAARPVVTLAPSDSDDCIGEAEFTTLHLRN